jgi:hypothetical protein
MVDLDQAEIGVMCPIFYYRLSERLSVFLPSAPSLLSVSTDSLLIIAYSVVSPS